MCHNAGAFTLGITRLYNEQIFITISNINQINYHEKNLHK